MVAEGLIRKTSSYIVGVHSIHYEICEEMFGSENMVFRVEVEVSNKIYNKIIKRRNEKLDDFKNTKDGANYAKIINKIHLSSEYIHNEYILKGIEYIMDIPYEGHLDISRGKEALEAIGVDTGRVTVFVSKYSSLERIKKGDIFVKRPDLSSRVYCNFSMMPREFRKYLTMDGRTLLALDIRNSQPLLAGAYMKAILIGKEQPIPQDLNEYIKLCEEGKFYESFNGYKKAKDRTVFKKEFFGKVFFGRVTMRKNKMQKEFISKFPSVYELLCELKGGYTKDKKDRGYAQFAIGLQRFEAGIMYDKVNKPMIEDGYDVFNIYDSIVGNDEDVLEEAKRRIYLAFEEYGVRPTINLEDFTKY